MASTKRGRPASPKAMRRDVFLKIRISRAEELLLEQYAHDQNLSVSDFARRRLGLSVSGYGERKAAKPAPVDTPDVRQAPTKKPTPIPPPIAGQPDEPPITLAQFSPWR